MEEYDWLQMLTYQQDLHHFSRRLLAQSQKRLLTASELELLSRLYLQTEQSTPLQLSRQSGMKKEAVSRCLKQLFEKNFIRKKKLPENERSYVLTITEAGEQALAQSYGPILQPLYDLRREMGGDFAELMEFIRKANRLMTEQEKSV